MDIKKNNPIDTDADPSPNPGARQLRHYWTRGKGAAKIRWGTPGDFNRCVSHLRKYVTDPKGLCNVYHVAAVGAAPGHGHGGGKGLEDSITLQETLIYASSLKELDMSKNLIELFNLVEEEEHKDINMELEHKQLATDSPAVGLTEVKEDGVVQALVSVTGIEDNVNDIIVPGAYEKTLKARTPKGVWAHDWNTPVSKVLDIKELLPGDENLPKTLANGEPWPAEAGALYVKAQFNLGTQRGREAFSDVQFYKDQAEWSIGYSVPKGKSEKNAKGTRLIKELNLFEYSPVLFGAASNARSLVSAAKALFDNEEDFLREVKDIVGGVDEVKPVPEEEVVVEETVVEPAKLEEAPADTTEEEHVCTCGHTPEELAAADADTNEEIAPKGTVVEEARVEDTQVPLTAESMKQIKALHDQLGTILSLITPAPVVEPEFTGSKSIEDALDVLIKGEYDSGIIQAIADNIADLKSAIKTMDTEAINDNANDALDEITFALQDPKTDEKTQEELKALVAAIGEELSKIETPAVEETPKPVETVETPKAIQISDAEWKSLLDGI